LKLVITPASCDKLRVGCVEWTIVLHRVLDFARHVFDQPAHDLNLLSNMLWVGEPRLEDSKGRSLSFCFWFRTSEGLKYFLEHIFFIKKIIYSFYYYYYYYFTN